MEYCWLSNPAEVALDSTVPLGSGSGWQWKGCLSLYPLGKVSLSVEPGLRQLESFAGACLLGCTPLPGAESATRVLERNLAVWVSS